MESSFNISQLSGTPLTAIVDCLILAFNDYYVSFPVNIEYWEQRFCCERIDYSLSFGAFENGLLVAFILHGVDTFQGELTAFNIGTGVLPQSRGKRVVDRLYEHAMPVFLDRNIAKCCLEVVQENARAMRVYERIGFQKTRELLSFRGEFDCNSSLKLASGLSLEKSGSFQLLLEEEGYRNILQRSERFQSWGRCTKALLLLSEYPSTTDDLLYVHVTKDSAALDGTSLQPVGSYIINKRTCEIVQIESCDPNSSEDWTTLATAAVCETVATASDSAGPCAAHMKNIDKKRDLLWNALIQCGLKNHINQFEMMMSIKMS